MSPKSLDVPVLSKSLDQRILASIKKQLPFEDIQYIYSTLDSAHPYLKAVVEAVSVGLESHKLRDFHKHCVFAAQNVEYAAEVFAFRSVLTQNGNNAVSVPRRRRRHVSTRKRNAAQMPSHATSMILH